MKCIYCGYIDSKVIDSRSNSDNNSIRRRRECLMCKKRWTTYESIETIPLLVIKKNGSIQPFDKHKIINGLIKACEKRPIGLDTIEELTDEIEAELKDNLAKEIRSLVIGNLILEKLKEIDDVSYIRYASVFKEFDNKTDYLNFIQSM